MWPYYDALLSDDKSMQRNSEDRGRWFVFQVLILDVCKYLNDKLEIM